jgi:hypothetical protein
MTELKVDLIEKTLRKEVQKLDKSVQLVAVERGKKEGLYRAALLKDGKSGSVDLQKEIIEKYLSQKDKGKELRRALAKAVSHLSIRYGR